MQREYNIKMDMDYLKPTHAHLLMLKCLGNSSYMFRANIELIFRESYSHSYTHCQHGNKSWSQSMVCYHVVTVCVAVTVQLPEDEPGCWLETCRSCFPNTLILTF
jgi:hypothetical protein